MRISRPRAARASNTRSSAVARRMPRCRCARIAHSRPVPKQTAMALKSGLAERCFAVSARWRPKPSRMRTVCSSAAMPAGMVRPGRSGWGSGGAAGQGVATASCSIPPSNIVRGVLSKEMSERPIRGGSHLRLISPWARRWQRRSGNCFWCMGFCLHIAVLACRNGRLNWCMGFWRDAGAGAWGSAGARAQGRRPIAATCGARRSKQGFNADAGRCTQNTRMGQGPPHRRGFPRGGAAIAAVNDHAGPQAHPRVLRASSSSFALKFLLARRHAARTPPG